MRTKIVFKIAFKNLWLNKMRTAITVLGVTIGIASIIFLVSLGFGLEQLVTNQVANFDAFTIIDVPSASVGTIKIDQVAIEKMSEMGHVKKVGAVTNLAGRIKKDENASTAETVVTGGDTNYWELSGIQTEVGHMPTSGNQAVINYSIMNLFGEADPQKLIGREVEIDFIIPSDLRSSQTDGLKNAEGINIKIVGVIKDNTSPMVFAHSDLLNKEDATKFSSLKIKADKNDSVTLLRKQIENMGFATEYVGDTVSQINQVFLLFRVVLAAFGLVALIVAALGTFNTLTISLLERIREVGLFKALGMKNKDVYRLFLSESLIIGLAGGFLGLLFGWALGGGVNLLLGYFADKAGSEHIKIFVTPWYFALGISAFSVLVGFLTGWYPSKRAVRIDPLDAMKYE